MPDFMMVSVRPGKRGVTEIKPKFIICKSRDLMIRGGDFYAAWIPEKNMWSTDEQDILRLIDKELDEYKESHQDAYENGCKVLYMWDAESGMIDTWHKYCQKQCRDNFHMLDEKLIFSNTVSTKEDYASKKLPYPLEPGSTTGWDILMNKLYSPKERHKIEWAIGSIVCGESRTLQKFMVLYGSAGTGKSTILNIIQKLFKGYVSVFNAKALGSASNNFALEAFKTNPLVAIEHDGDLSRIEDNTRINSLVSHEDMTVNEKFRSAYSNRFKCFLFIGTNKPVKITDAKSGLLRRLIDVSPTGEKLSAKEYKDAVALTEFELGHIAYHCAEVYRADPGYYDNYIPLAMMGASNDFYNFILQYWNDFSNTDEITLNDAWKMYNAYCEYANVTAFKYRLTIFKEELKNYFREYKERGTNRDGTRVWNLYSGFRKEKFIERPVEEPKPDSDLPAWMEFREQKSILDDIYKDCPAQYATSNGTPKAKWADVTTKLSDISTDQLHYVKTPENLIVIDFDIPDESGAKNFKLNAERAKTFPPTYAELSKSGQGIHLHYIYDGDVNRLSRVYENHVEVKVYTGGSALRRMVTKCNHIPIARISTGLPLREGKISTDVQKLRDAKDLQTKILRAIHKEYEPHKTICMVDFINHLLEEANEMGMSYDIRPMKQMIRLFAESSHNSAEKALRIYKKMKFCSDDCLDEDIEPSGFTDETKPIAFFDIEVFPNVIFVNYKVMGEGHPMQHLINPTPRQIASMVNSYRLIGYNNLAYDNVILWYIMLGWGNMEIYKLSKTIVSSKKGEFFPPKESKELSFCDVFDIASKKQSLKRYEIEFDQVHKELGRDWDQPVPESEWEYVSNYCDNDVISTEKTFIKLEPDWKAREMLANISGLTPNDSTNKHTGEFIFEKDQHPQSQFNYRNLALPVVPKEEIL